MFKRQAYFPELTDFDNAVVKRLGEALMADEFYQIHSAFLADCKLWVTFDSLGAKVHYERPSTLEPPKLPEPVQAVS